MRTDDEPLQKPTDNSAVPDRERCPYLQWDGGTRASRQSQSNHSVLPRMPGKRTTQEVKKTCRPGRKKFDSVKLMLKAYYIDYLGLGVDSCEDHFGNKDSPTPAQQRCKSPGGPFICRNRSKHQPVRNMYAKPAIETTTMAT
jgi:hypothetical protein